MTRIFADSPVAPLLSWLHLKFRRALIEINYLVGNDAPAMRFLDEFSATATKLPIRIGGTLGQLRGHGTQTVVVDLSLPSSGIDQADDQVVLKFEIYPGAISLARLAAESRNEKRARQYLDQFMPKTLRVLGHGLRNATSALTLQQRVNGVQLREVTWSAIASSPALCHELIRFCNGVLLMANETGRVPDLAGTLPRVDHLTNIFWRSRNILVDADCCRVWLVDTGWKEGEESLREGKLRSRLRTRFRLATLRSFRRLLLRWLQAEA